MKKLLSTFCFVAAAAISGTVAYLYVTDREVKEKVDKAAASVMNAAMEIKDSLNERRVQKEREMSDNLAKNQTWVDEQWEALGI